MNKGKITNVRGDATEPQFTAPNEIAIIPHCCNNNGGWGKGFVLALSKKWTMPEVTYRRFCETNKGLPILGKVCYAKIDNHHVVVNMIGQDGTVSEDNLKPVKYRALANAMAEVVGYIDMIQNQTDNPVVIHTPKFGSDLAGGNWDFILELIDEIWCGVGIDVVAYEFEPDPEKWGPVDPIERLKKMARKGDEVAIALLDDRHRPDNWWKDENWDAELKPILEPLLVTVEGYASLSVGEQLWLLKARFSLSEKETREIRTDDIYSLPYPLASDFEGFEESKYPVI